MASKTTKVKVTVHNGSCHQPATTPSPSSQAMYLQKLQESSEAIKAGNFRRAIQLYTEAIDLDPDNHILYTNRSAAYLKNGQVERSLEDAIKARTICPKWGKAYLREGVALRQLGRHGDSLAAFACGLGQEPGNCQLLEGLLEASLASPLKDKLETTFQQLEKFGLKSKPFVIIAVIGQELLAAGHFSSAVTILEAALKVGTCSLKLRGSVFSALSSALWGLGNLDKAIYHMQQDLAVAKNLGDREGECRAYGNLGSAYFTKGHFKESLANHRFQLVLAMKLKDCSVASSALSSLGHVYTAIGDYPNALASHKQCVLLLKQSREVLMEAKEIGNVGAVYLAMGNFENAVECHQEHLKIAKSLKSSMEEARAYSNLGSAYHYKRNYQKAMMFHKEVLKIAEQIKDKTLEARAYAGLGHAARCSGDTMTAKGYHEKQLDNALQTKDKVAEGRACSNLGIIFHQLGEFEAALKLHKVHMKIAKTLQDRASQGRAYGNIGNAYSALGKHELAVKQHKQELAISSEVKDRHSEGSTHGNLAVAYQALGKTENALHHYLSHLSISRELKDLPSEARALCNLGNFHCVRGNHSSAVSFYEQFLALSRELNDSEGESKACFNLGYVHFNLGNFSEAVSYYEQDLAFARDRKDRLALARAYCNLGLAHKSLQRFDEALECQKKCLKLMDALENTPGKLRALGNIGDLMMKVGDINEAMKIYQQQVNLARQCDSPDLLATAYGALGSAHRMLCQYDKSLAYHTQELNIRQEISDLRGECRAHGNVGNVHMSLGNFLTAFKCYQEMLERSRELKDHRLEGQACGNLGITRMNMGQYEEAIGLLEEQLAMLEQHYGPRTFQDKGKAFGNLGDCYEALGDYEEAVKWHEQFLIIAQQTKSLTDQDRAYRGLGNAHKAIGNLQQALVCFEKRLYVAHQTNSAAAKASAYGELGCLHSLLGNLEQAIACLEHQLSLAQEMGDATCQGDAACGLGGVYQQMGEYSTALTYHQMDLRIAEETNSTACQCRAFGNLGLSHESLGNLKEAIEHQNQHLSIAAQLNDGVAKTLAYSSLGRVHHALSHYTEAVQYLQQGLQIAEQLRRREDEAKIRHRLGLSLWSAGDLDQCQQQLHRAADLFETIRRESQCSSEYRLSLFDLQTACYQTLQRVLVSLNHHDEALVVAERACTRAFIDLLLERQAGSAGMFNGTTMDLTPISIEQLTSTVANQNSIVLCFSIASGQLYSWLLTPKRGIVKFHSLRLSDLDADSETMDTRSFISVSGLSLLDQCVGQLRESMGIESHITTTATGHRSSIALSGHDYSDTDSEVDDVFQLQLEELGDKLNADTDRTGFLAMLNRSHNLNASSYSLGSVLSTGGASVNSNLLNSLGGSMRSLGLTSLTSGSVRSNDKLHGSKSKLGGAKSPLSMLYQYLIEPMEAAIAEVKETDSMLSGCDSTSSHGMSDPTDLVLVLQGDLYLVPFLMLRREQAESFLFEKYTILIVPSISALQNSQSTDTRGRPLIQSSGALVVGNPRLTPVICQHWHLQDIPGAEFEARILGELLTCRPLIGAEATKGAVLHQIEQVEVIHFAAHISWKLSSVVLSPGEFISSPSQHIPVIDSDDSSSDIGAVGGPSLSEYLLTAADILNLKLRARLVVLNSGYTDYQAGRVNTDGVVGLTRSLLSAGAQCVLFSLWPVPDQASKLLMKTLYTALLDGLRVTRALSLAVKTVQTSAQFSHPSNWGGWVLVGSDITLSSKVAIMGHALEVIVQAHSTCRQTLKVLLHLVEKSLQRIHQGCKNSMFTTQQSIENKVGQVAGWKDLLQAVGFRFEPATDGLPPAVFFPQSDPNERLTQASASLQAFLGLPTSSLAAMSKFISVSEVGEALIHVLREILSKLSAKETMVDVMVDVRMWGVSGCHEFLASLGLDLVDVGSDSVTLRLSKQAVKRHLQFALQALVSVFDTKEAPCSLHLDTSSSMESLSSSQSAPSSSTFSKSSVTPPMSPYARNKRSSITTSCVRGKRSLFNPAEMEKVKNSHRNSLLLQTSIPGRQFRGSLSLSSSSEQSTPSASPKSPRSPQLDPALQLSHQAHIRSVYGVGCNQNTASSGGGQTISKDSQLGSLLQGLSVDGKDAPRFSTASSDSSSIDGISVRLDSDSVFTTESNVELSHIQDRKGERSDDSKIPIKSSLSSVTQQIKNSSISEESIPKTVKFAEKLISEEISFDSSSPRFDSGSEEGGSPRSRDAYPCDKSAAVTGTDVRALPEREALDKFKSYNKASELREHYEKLNRQNSTPDFKNAASAFQNVSYISSQDNKRSEVKNVSHNNGTENVALKILADVASQRTAVEFMQRQSLIQSQAANYRFHEEKATCQPVSVPNKASTDSQNYSTQPRDSLNTSSHSLARDSLNTSSHSLARDSLNTSSHSLPKDSLNASSHSLARDSLNTSSHSLPKESLNASSHSLARDSLNTSSHSLPKDSLNASSHSLARDSLNTSSHSLPKDSLNTSSHSLARDSLNTSSHSLDFINKSDKTHSALPANSTLPLQTSSQRLLLDKDKSSQPEFTSVPVSRTSAEASPAKSFSKPMLTPKPNFCSPQLPHTRRQPAQQQQPVRPQQPVQQQHRVRQQQSAYNALFPRALRPPSPRVPLTSAPTDAPPSSPRLTLLGGRGQISAGSGENSISSDNSEGCESNMQSSVSSGYHSEKNGFICTRMQTIPPPSDNQDKGIFTQEFVNRTPSFTYSSGSSSPFSRTSNDDGGPDNSSSAPLCNVFFPNHLPKPHDHVMTAVSRQPMSSSLPVNMANSNGHASRKTQQYGDSIPSNSSQPLTPAVPLVRTNALQSRPESSNSLSSHYSTSSSTLSTIHRPCISTDSPRVWDKKSPLPLPDSSYRSDINSRLLKSDNTPSLSYPATANGSNGNNIHQNSASTSSTILGCYPIRRSQTEGNINEHLTSSKTQKTSNHDNGDYTASRCATKVCLYSQDSNNADPDEAEYRAKLGNIQSIMFDPKLHSHIYGHKNFDPQNIKTMFRSYEQISSSISRKETSAQNYDKSIGGSHMDTVVQSDISQRDSNVGGNGILKDERSNIDTRKRLPPSYLLHSSKC